MAENGKNNFLLSNRLDAVVSKLSDKQAGVLFKGVLGYANKGMLTDFEDGMVAVVFEMIRQDMDYAAKKYAETCAKRAASGKLGGRPKKANKSKCFFKKANESKQKHNDNDNDVDVDMIKNNIYTAPKSADPPQQTRKLNELQQFAEQVLEHFEPDVKTKDQKSVWYKRNCRCLRDILNFCGKDIPLALKTIDVCLDRMDKAGFTCGYEAVVRNIPEYYSVAKMKMEGAYAKKE